MTPPTTTFSAAFGWQDPEYPIPDHIAERIQGSENQRSAGHSTLIPVWNRQIRSGTAGKSPEIDISGGANSPRGFLARGFSDDCLHASAHANDRQASENP
jgi:hypothetical protein